MEVPRVGVKSELQLLVYTQPQLQQHGIQAVTATYTTTGHGSTGSLARPEIETASSWMLVRFVHLWGTTGTLKMSFFKKRIFTDSGVKLVAFKSPVTFNSVILRILFHPPLHSFSKPVFNFFFWPCPQHVEFLRPEIEPMPQLQPKPEQWQHQILNPLCHQGIL